MWLLKKALIKLYSDTSESAIFKWDSWLKKMAETRSRGNLREEWGVPKITREGLQNRRRECEAEAEPVRRGSCPQDNGNGSGDSYSGWAKKLLNDRFLGPMNEKSFEYWTAFQELPRPELRRKLRTGQLILSCLTLLMVVCVSEMRNFFMDRIFVGHWTVFVIEFSSWIALTTFLLLFKRSMMPSNYMPVAILRAFISLQLQFEWFKEKEKKALEAEKAQELQEEGEKEKAQEDRGFYAYIFWMLKTVGFLKDEAGPDASTFSNTTNAELPKGEECTLDPIVINLGFALALMFLGFLCSHTTKIRVDKLGNLCLALNFASCFCGIWLMLGSLTLPRGRELVENHRFASGVWAFCSLWISITSTFHLTQVHYHHRDQYWKQKGGVNWAETAVFALEIMITQMTTVLILKYVNFLHPTLNIIGQTPMILKSLVVRIFPLEITAAWGNAVNLIFSVASKSTTELPNAMS